MTVPSLKLHDAINSGRFGTVYRCTYSGIKQPVAVKRLLKNRQDIPMDINNAMISKEVVLARALANGACENVIKVHEILEDEEAVYQVMELCDATLGEVSPCDVPVRQFIRDMARGLDHLHSRHIVHCDLKPDNILVTRDTFKIADLGSCIHTGSSEKVIFATPFYAAPEITNKQGGDISPGIDIWALGVIIYTITHGSHPFTDTEGRIDPRQQLHLREDEFKELLSRMLERNQYNRITAAEILKAI